MDLGTRGLGGHVANAFDRYARVIDDDREHIGYDP